MISETSTIWVNLGHDVNTLVILNLVIVVLAVLVFVRGFFRN